jgi:hypothetical protein
MQLTTVSAALDILSKASKALDSLREQAKGSKDATLKENISRLYDDFLDLKAAIMRVTEENGELRRGLAQQSEKAPKPEIRTVGTTNYYFLGDAGPFCQPCYDVNGKLINLAPLQDYAGGIGRKCEVCNKVFFEGPKPNRPQRQIKVGPWS